MIDQLVGWLNAKVVLDLVEIKAIQLSYFVVSVNLVKNIKIFFVLQI